MSSTRPKPRPQPRADQDAAGRGSWKIPDLDDKMDILREAIAAFLQDRHLRDGVIAKEIGVSDSDWWKMKTGNKPVSPDTLSDLVKYINFGIEPGIFRLSMTDFVAWLRDNKKGNFGDIRENRPIGELRKRARPKSKTETFKIIPIEPRSGLGTEADLTESSPVLRVGGYGRIEVSIPQGGCFLVLNEQVADGEVTAIVPSPLYPAVSQSSDAIVVIPKNGPMRVVGPAGRYRVYAVWMSVPLQPDFLALLIEGEPSDGRTGKLCRLTHDQVKILVAHLQKYPANSNRVLMAEYQVVE